MLEGVKRYPVPFEKAARIVIGCDEFVDRMKLFPGLSAVSGEARIQTPPAPNSWGAFNGKPQKSVGLSQQKGKSGKR